MTSWEQRTERLTTADLPTGCDECGAPVGIDAGGQPVGGQVLGDIERDYVFCTDHAVRVRQANPTATIVVLPVSTP